MAGIRRIAGTLLLSVCFTAACRDAVTPPSDAGEPAPRITSLSPAEAAAGMPGLTLTVEGEHLSQNGIVRWNGTGLPTTHEAPSRLVADVPARLLETPGTASITVVDPATRLTSDPVTLPVLEPIGVRRASGALEAGGSFTCGVGPDGAAYCWGRNDRGQLANGTIFGPPQLTPAPVSGGIVFREIALSFTRFRGFACGLSTEGQTYCWGAVRYPGQLRLMSSGSYRAVAPEPIAIGFDFAMLAVGAGHACGLTDAGHVWCWGENRTGQLGNGEFGGTGPGGDIVERTPIQVEWTTPFRLVTAGAEHSCALTHDARAVCWGRLGLLGVGERGGGISEETVRGPTLVNGNHRFATVAAGRRGTCGLTHTGRALCWGQVGDPLDAPTNLEPTPLDDAPRFISISVGPRHACALDVDGKAHCWGSNRHGQLGNGRLGGTTAAPAPVVGSPRLLALDAGPAHTCAVADNRTGYCWGERGEGRLGNARADFRVAATPVIGGHAFAELAGSCGLTDAGTVYCWGPLPGAEDFETTSGHAATPTRVDGPVPLASIASTVRAGLSDTAVCGIGPDGDVYCAGGAVGSSGFVRFAEELGATKIVAGTGHHCALLDDGRVVCWGANTKAQLGDGTLKPRDQPVPVSGDEIFIDLAAGAAHTCALTDDGRALCWGSNELHSLGTTTAERCPTRNEEIECSRSPIEVGGGLRFSSIEAGAFSSCGFTEQDELFCWGLLDEGDDGTERCHSNVLASGLCAATPVRIKPGIAFSDIAFGMLYACALDGNGTALCWGENRDGRLGNGSYEQGFQQRVPTPVTSAVPFSSISLIDDTVCALTAAGAAYCWGHARLGQVGDGEDGFETTPATVIGTPFTRP